MKQPSKINRRHSREFILQVLYAYELQGTNIRDVCNAMLPLEWQHATPQRDFVFRYIDAVLETKSQSEAVIEEHVTNWDIGRICIIDKIVLRMAITEFLIFQDIPIKVSINEAIEIARMFSTEQSPSFVNGVLNSVLESLIARGLIKKSGRGLIDLSHKPAVYNQKPATSKS